MIVRNIYIIYNTIYLHTNDKYKQITIMINITIKGIYLLFFLS